MYLLCPFLRLRSRWRRVPNAPVTFCSAASTTTRATAPT